MDLIEQLIQAKKHDNEIPLKEVLVELIKYDKLSKSDKFKHIVDSPILQKQLPYCWSAFNQDAKAYWLVNEASTILQNLVDYQLEIFNDLAEFYSKKKRKQMEILGNVHHYNFKYYGLQLAPKDLSDKTNVLYLTEKTHDKNVIRLSVIVLTKEVTAVYQGRLSIGEKQKKERTIIPEFKYDTGYDYVKITLYSNQGNNDFDFAKTKYFKVSMPDSNSIMYKFIINKVVEWYSIVTISDNDERLLSFNTDNMNVVAETIMKYLPELPPKMKQKYKKHRMKLLMQKSRLEVKNETK